MKPETFCRMPLGIYQFTSFPAGRNYVIAANLKRNTFSTNSRLVWLREDLTEENFLAEGNR